MAQYLLTSLECSCIIQASIAYAKYANQNQQQ